MIFKLTSIFILYFLIFEDTYSSSYYLNNNLSTNISQEDSAEIIKAKRESVIKYLKGNNVWKNPYIALGIAIFPGAIVHGFGHFYAGHRKTAYTLFSSEIISIISLPVAISIFGLEGGVSTGDAKTLGNILLFLFIGSWAYDIIGAPLTCVNYNNKKIKEYWTVQPYINNSQFDKKIGLKFCYHF